MALCDSVLEIADEIEKEADEVDARCQAGVFHGDCLTVSNHLRGFVKALRLVVKAADVPKIQSFPAESLGKLQLQVPYQLPTDAEFRAKQEMRRNKAEDDYATSTGENFTVLKGGHSDGTTVPIAPNAPVGAMTAVSRQVYKKNEQGVWEFSAEDTDRVFPPKSSRIV